MKNLQSRISGFKTPLDKEALWSAIQSKRQIKKGNVYLLTFVLGLFLISVISLTVFWINKSDTVNKKQEYINDKYKVEAYKNDNNEVRENEILVKHFDAEIKEKETKSSQSVLISEPSLENSKNQNTTNFQYKPVDKLNSNITIDNKINNVDPLVSVVIKSKNVQTLNDGIVKEPSIIIEKANNKLLSIHEIANLDFNLISSSENNITIKNVRKTSMSTQCFSFKNKHPLSLIAYVSYDNLFRSMNSSVPTLQSYIDLRNSTEKILEGYRAGIQLKYGLPSGLYFKGGLEFSRINENFYHADTITTTKILPNQVIRLDIGSNGDTTEVFGMGIVTTIETKRWEVYNTFTSINFPLLVGYQKDMNKWSIGLEVGVLINSSTSFTGMILDETKNVIDASGLYKSSFGLGILGGVSIGYYIGPGLKFLIIPSFQRQLGFINNSTNPIQQRYTRYGVGIGVEWVF